MVQVNKLSSADIWNLNYTFSEVLELYRKGKYPEAVKMAKKGLSMATNTGDLSWIYKFDEVLTKTVKTCNTANKLIKMLSENGQY
jgi:hypothetical protein